MQNVRMQTQNNSFLDGLRTIVGASHVLTDDLGFYELDWRKKYHGKALAVVKPANAGEISQIIKLCAAHRISIVPQAGHTSLVGGSVPNESGEQLVLNVARLNAIRAIDLVNNTMTVEAGCILQTVQETATAHDRLYPLSLAAEGSCQIGGNIGTNAGGVQVLRYGNTRELIMGIEVVLPSGEILESLRGLRKDNTGYDLKQLFIGAEGTLGIVTAAVLKLYPKPRATQTVIVGLQSPTAALKLLNLMRSHLAERLTAFELISALSLSLVLKHIPGQRAALADQFPWYVLLEANDSQSIAQLELAMQTALEEAFEAELIQDAVLSKNETEAKQFWGLRENITEAQTIESKNIKHDISVPISKIAEFIERTDALLEAKYPGVRIVNFGHLGDGNLHYNIAHPVATHTEASWFALYEEVNELVHDSVHHFGGSISAEHGIGQLKREQIKRYKSDTELKVMRAIKAALDPLGIMNPGKVI
jgi:FAD/FMN-containing dehydrogenase